MTTTTETIENTIRKIWQSMYDAAGQLGHHQRTGCNEGDECLDDLVRGITAQLTTDQERQVLLRELVLHNLFDALIGVPLDETENDSYKLLGECATRIADLVWLQAEGSDEALRLMIADHISDVRHSLIIPT